MGDGGFDENFTWYEWSFVSPEQVPTDDLQVPGADRSFEDGHPSAIARGTRAHPDEVKRWMT